MKVYGYARVSTTKQDLKPQIEAIQKYAKSKNWEVVQIYQDFGQSGSTKERPHLKAMLYRIENNDEVEAVIVTSLDRFGRSVQDLSNMVALLETNGVKFVSIKENIHTTDKLGRLMFNILGSIAEFEREIIRERMQEGKARAKAKGVICHRPKKDLDIDKIKDLYKAGISVSGIARLMNVTKNTINSRLREMGLK